MSAVFNPYASLTARAYAQQRWPEIGFHDSAASLLATLLGVSKPLQDNPVWELGCLLRSQWFDQRCSSFFEQYPQGMCIDLGAGLSTRFHRLSESADWPRFSWVDVDLPEIVKLKSRAIPRIDNYQLLTANIVEDDWLSLSGWHPQVPLIITLESVLSYMPLEDIYKVFVSIAKHCTGNNKVEIVFDYSRSTGWYERLWQSSRFYKQKSLVDYLLGLGFVLIDTVPAHAGYSGFCKYHNNDLLAVLAAA